MEITTDAVTIRTPEGKTMPCHLAAPTAGGPYPAVVVVMEAFGLNAHIRAVADRIAGEGYVAIAPDLYHRFGSDTAAYTDMPKALDLLKRLDAEASVWSRPGGAIMDEVGAVIAHLKGRRDVKGDRIGIVGFCMGGTVAFRAAAHHPADVKAVVSFYGGGIAGDSPTAPITAAERIAAPVLALFGEKDQMIPEAQVQRIEETMKRLGKTYEGRVYQGAGHGFFCDERGSYHPESAKDAWGRLTAWFSKYLK